jgi:hypothetical protein
MNLKNEECPLLAEEDYRPLQFIEGFLWRKQTLKMKYSAAIYEPQETLGFETSEIASSPGQPLCSVAIYEVISTRNLSRIIYF